MQQEQQEPEANTVAPGDLCARIAAGDHDAEALLYDRYRRGVVFLLSRQCGDPALAADLAQDALVKVLLAARAGEIRNPDALATYVRSVAVNMLIALRRKEKRRRTSSVDPNEGDPFPDEQSLSLLEDLKRDQLKPIVERLLAKLSVERDRDILVRYFLRDEDKQDICEHWGLTASQFDSVIHRARMRLKAIVSQQYESADLLGQVAPLVLLLLLPTVGASQDLTEKLRSSHWDTMAIESPGRPS